MELLNEEYLAHHGILGMKWGVRRYQNEDGTYTSLGKKREREEYNGDGDGDKKKDKEPPSKKAWAAVSDSFRAASSIPGKAHSANKAKRLGKEDMSKMSDEELFARTQRLTLERNYMNALSQADVSYGAQRAQQVLEIAGSLASIAASISSASYNFALAKQVNNA